MFLVLFLIAADTSWVNYKADTLNYQWEEGIILLIGHAEVETPEMRAQADTIRYDSRKEIVKASGNPILWVGNQEISGKEMWYDLRARKGIVYDGRTKIRKGWFDGKIIRKVGEQELNVDYGKFTTCEDTPPHYYFWGRELKIYVDDMVYTRPLVLCVQDIPLFIAPFWWFPIKKGRKSGFLYPKIGRSDVDGRYVKNIAYYWVTNAWSDVTFALDYLEKRGPLFAVEGRWSIRPLLSGNFNASYIEEQRTRKRWSLDFSHRHNLGERFSVKAKGRFVSDAEYEVDYKEERLVQLNKILISYLSISKSWDIGSISSVVQEKRDLNKNSFDRLLPQISYSINIPKFFGAYYSYSGKFTNSIEKDESSEEQEQCFENNFTLRAPFKLFRYFSLSPSTSQSYTYKRRQPLYRYYRGSYSLSLSTNIYGRTMLGPEVRHIMSPRISYSWTDRQTWEGDKFSRDTSRTCSFSITNNFQVVFGEKVWSLAKLDLRSSWNFEESKINPVNMTFYSNPFPMWNIRANATYRPYEQEEEKFKLEKVVSSFSLRQKDFSLNLSHDWAPERDQTMWGTIKVQLTRNWKLSFSRRYNLTQGETIDQKFSLSRDLHCWEASFDFNQYGEHWRYDFKLQLKAIPEIKVGRGVIGIFL